VRVRVEGGAMGEVVTGGAAGVAAAAEGGGLSLSPAWVEPQQPCQRSCQQCVMQPWCIV
jgi:hypothetical protein